MKIDILTLCHSALAQGNELSILGAFNILHVRSLPYSLESTFLVLRLTSDSSDEGEHDIKINVMETDGRIVVEALCRLPLPPLPPHLSESLHPSLSLSIVFQLGRTELRMYGEQALCVSVDGKDLFRTPFYIYRAD